jgi:hypothetical protein
MRCLSDLLTKYDDRDPARTTLLFSSNVRFVIGLHAVKELLPALGVPDVLNADVDTLLDVPVANNLVDDDTNGMRGNIVHNARPAKFIHDMRRIRREN